MPPPSSKRPDAAVYAYVRLSRDDEKQAGSLDEKFLVRSGICKRLAAENGLNLPDENILLEQKSGKLLSARPKMLHLLDLVREGKVSGIVTPYIDRMVRGDKADEAKIEDAFCLAGIKVWTYEQTAPIVFDDDYDPLMFEVKASLARNELRTYARRRKATDREKLARGKRSRAVAPFGFRYLRATFDPLGNPLTAARHEVIASEWPILVEIFERIHTDSMRAICRDFNLRGVPGPGVGRTDRAADKWYPTSLRGIILNPFYAGYLSQRSKRVRGQTILFNHVDYVLSDAAGDWPAVISLDDWRDLISTWKARKRPTRAPESDAILTGLLFNFCGRSMMHTRTAYSCRCGDPMMGRESFPVHDCLTIAHSKIHRYVLEVLDALVDRLPEGKLPAPKKPIFTNAKTILREINRLRAEIARFQDRLDDMSLEEKRRIEDYGVETFWRGVRKLQSSIEDMKAELAVKEAEQAEIEDAGIGAAVMAGVARIGTMGFRQFWQEASNSERRAIASGFIKRIDFLQTEQKRQRGNAPLERRLLKDCTVTLRPWCAPYLPADQMPKMKGRYAPPRTASWGKKTGEKTGGDSA